MTICHLIQKKALINDNLQLNLVEDIDQIDFNEPSGIVFHAERETLFVIGDEGDIAEIETDGTLIKQSIPIYADFEGITYIPATGMLYVAIEGEEIIVEIDPDDFTITNQFTIDPIFEGKQLFIPDEGQGVEAITFVPDSNHPAGGTFYLSNQGMSLTDEEDPSIIFEVELPVDNNTEEELTATIISYFKPEIVDMSGLHYNQDSEHLYIISDTENTVFEVTTDGQILQSFSLPGEDQEGITIDEEGFFYIAQDSGGIIQLEWD